MRRELDERVGLAMLETAVVSLAHGLCEGLECCAHGRSTNRVQPAADKKRSILPYAELKPTLLHGDTLLLHHALGIERVPKPHAVVPETPGRRFPRALEQVVFGEGRLRRQRIEGLCRTCGGEVGEADLTGGPAVCGFL